jgi:hypothetical protein
MRGGLPIALLCSSAVDGVRLAVPGTGKSRVALAGSVGGFGLGSDFASQVYPMIGYRISRLLEVGAACRAMGMDYSTGSGKEEFVYDITTFGPELGVGFHF